MPTYIYRCTRCDRRSQQVLPMDRHDDPDPCEACGGDQRQVFGRVAVQLRGWGFRSTDAMVPDRPDRGSFRDVAERAERISDGD